MYWFKIRYNIWFRIMNFPTFLYIVFTCFVSLALWNFQWYMSWQSIFYDTFLVRMTIQISDRVHNKERNWRFIPHLLLPFMFKQQYRWANLHLSVMLNNQGGFSLIIINSIDCNHLFYFDLILLSKLFRTITGRIISYMLWWLKMNYIF